MRAVKNWIKNLIALLEVGEQREYTRGYRAGLEDALKKIQEQEDEM